MTVFVSACILSLFYPSTACFTVIRKNHIQIQKQREAYTHINRTKREKKKRGWRYTKTNTQKTRETYIQRRENKTEESDKNEDENN